MEETITNKNGGKQSRINSALSKFPPMAAISVGQVLKIGADKYGHDPLGVENWRLISSREHLDHALEHVFNYLHDQDLEELSHATCRMLMALEMDLVEHGGFDEIRNS